MGESKAGEPRSYIVRAHNHEYKRDPKDILNTQENSPTELVDTANSESCRADCSAEDTRPKESHWELTSGSSPTINRVSGRVNQVLARYQE